MSNKYPDQEDRGLDFAGHFVFFVLGFNQLFSLVFTVIMWFPLVFFCFSSKHVFPSLMFSLGFRVPWLLLWLLLWLHVAPAIQPDGHAGPAGWLAWPGRLASQAGRLAGQPNGWPGRGWLARPSKPVRRPCPAPPWKPCVADPVLPAPRGNHWTHTGCMGTPGIAMEPFSGMP